MEKPILYHGSVAEIETFVPRDGVNNAFKRYHGILGTELKSRAMLYALKVKEGYEPGKMETALGGAKDARGVDFKDFMITNHTINGVPCAVIRDRKKFLAALEKSGGGSLYTLPNDSFTEVKRDDGIPAHEWCSEQTNIAPIAKERVTLDGVMREGAQILFMKDGMNFDDFERIFKPREREVNERDEHVALYREMIQKGVLFDENAHRGISNALNLSAPQREMQQQQSQQQQAQHFGSWSRDPRNQPGHISGRVR